MAITYTKEMRRIAKEQCTNLMTIAVPGFEFQTPSGTDEQRGECNGKGAWKLNNWVFAYEYKTVEVTR